MRILQDVQESLLRAPGDVDKQLHGTKCDDELIQQALVVLFPFAGGDLQEVSTASSLPLRQLSGHKEGHERCTRHLSQPHEHKFEAAAERFHVK